MALVKVGALELLAKHKKIGQPPQVQSQPSPIFAENPNSAKTSIQGSYYKLTKYCYNVVSKANLVRMMICIFINIVRFKCIKWIRKMEVKGKNILPENTVLLSAPQVLISADQRWAVLLRTDQFWSECLQSGWISTDQHQDCWSALNSSEQFWTVLLRTAQN